MPTRVAPEKPLVTVKAPGFEQLVKEIFQRRFGIKTNTAIAELVGVTPGRISQILRYPDRQMPETIFKLARPFDDRRILRRMYDAWYRVTLTLHDLEPVTHTDNEALKRCGHYIRQEDPFKALHIIESALKIGPSPQFRLPIIDHCFMVNMIIMDLPDAMRYAKLMEVESRELDDKLMTARSYCMQAAVLRALGDIPVPEVSRLLDDALELTRSVAEESLEVPPSKVSQRLRNIRYERISFALERTDLDRVKVRAYCRNNIRLIEELIEGEAQNGAKCPMMLLRSRMLIELGRLDEAEAELAAALALGGDNVIALVKKAELVRIKLLVARGETVEARSRAILLRRECLLMHDRFLLKYVERELSQLLFKMSSPEEIRGECRVA